ncbi:hypothetical protein BLNAU_8092 [Blattamonas nauphoetae]|uniref:Uncharacterized protein n=1 Tax=Blattamonas nauphoetae TaxID=2049346 RepID=A0ABQ9XZT5_9EUKA|nr:hypothetical protein BLNAU_8092 [Blattamonas nauphoetae]
MTQLLSKDDLEHSILTPKQTKATGNMSSRKRSAVASPGTPGGLSFGTIHSGNALPPVRFGAETNEMNGVNETPWKPQVTAAAAGPAVGASQISDGPTELKRHSIAGTRPHPSHAQKKQLTRQSSAQLGSPSTTFPNTSPKQSVEIRSASIHNIDCVAIFVAADDELKAAC